MGITKKSKMEDVFNTEDMKLIPNVVTSMQNMYNNKIKPIEQLYLYDRFYAPLMETREFSAKPMVLLIGQYSVGKTSFIRYCLERDFPGQRIGPEPTTDKFTALMYGNDERVIPGNAAAVSQDFAFTTLQEFGSGFLNRFEVVEVPANVLENVTFVDSPGILSGEKQRINRSYNFSEIITWFANKCDRILLLFDAHKLDISDEMKEAIEALRGNDDKIRVVLNKADSVDKQQLMRIYGALMWSLGRVVSSPEVLRVYIGSFWDQPIRYEYFKDLFIMEQTDLFADLRALPANSVVRKINDLVRRTRLTKCHALILSYLKGQMPKVFGKQKKQQELIDNMPAIFQQLQAEYRLPASDFPEIEGFKKLLENMDFTTFPKYEKDMFDQLDIVLSKDIPALMNMLPKPEKQDANAEQAKEAGENPFAAPELVSNAGNWRITQAHKAECDNIFSGLKTINGKVSGAACKDIMMKSDLPTDDLRKIWELADVDQDGKFDAGEFAVAMYLINDRMAGNKLPDTLPEDLVPPSKRSKHVL
ncbi:hypothetical protein WA158_005502 [Blastocystis sp. Blastoise]